MTAFEDLPWRVGRREGRHMYALIGEEPSDDDPPIGTLDTREIAAEACRAHNGALKARSGNSPVADAAANID
jgi:hypothetical protein